MRPLIFLIAVAIFLGAQLGNADDTAPDSSIPTLWVCGDSTASNGRDRGWASHLQEFFDRAKLRVENRARGGRSSRTFLSEGLWDAVMSEAKPGDFVVIQFGHNDGGPLDRDRARGSLRGTGDASRDVIMPDGKHETVHTYGWYLRRFVSDARAHQATPIIASPIVRNDWRDGKVIRAQGYPIWSAEIAHAEECPFVDASNIIADRYDAMGEAAVKPLFPEEHTHTSAIGAKLNAELLASGFKSLDGGPLDKYLSDRGQAVAPAIR
jgi:lysophospholipase L1-like esterase